MSAENLDNPPLSADAPEATESHFRALVNSLMDPVVIMDQRGRVCFMNPRAERMLANGLRERLEAHLASQARLLPISQVRFRLQTGKDLILRIGIAETQWKGEQAVQVSLKDVTPYIAAAQQLGQEIAKSGKREEEWQGRCVRHEGQLRALAAERDLAGRQVEAALAELRGVAEERDEARRAAEELRAGRRELDELARQQTAELAEADRCLTDAGRLLGEKSAELEKANAEIARLRESVAEAAHGAEELRTVRQAAEERARAQAVQLAAAAEELAGEAAAAQAAEKEAERLRQALHLRDGVEEENARLRDRVAEGGRASEELRAARQAAEEQAREQAAQLAAAEERAREQAAQLAAAEERAREQAAQLAATEERARAQAAQLAAAEERAREQAAQLVAAEERAREQAAQLAAAAEELAGEAAAAQAAEKEAERLRQALHLRDGVEEENARLRDQVAEGGRAAEELRSARQAAEEQARAQAAQLAAAEEQARAQTARLETAAGQLAEAGRRLSEKTAELERAHAAVAELRQSQAEAERVAGENERLRREAAASARRIEALEEEQHRQAARADESARELAAAGERLRERQEETERLRQEISKAQRTGEDLEAECARLQIEVEGFAAAQEESKAQMEKEISVREDRQEQTPEPQGRRPGGEAFGDRGLTPLEQERGRPARDLPAGPEARRAVEVFSALLRECSEREASDLHLATGQPPYLRIHGRLLPAPEHGDLTDGQLRAIVGHLTAGEARLASNFQSSLDGVTCAPDGTRFRFNVFRDRHGLSVACRRLESRFRTLAELLLPEKLGQLCALKDGLVILAGPAGAGKSTTLGTLLDGINHNRRGHIITIEDPIEFVHQSALCLVNQRQVGVHASSFNDALIAALRQDPDIIVVGEMRDKDTIRTVLTAADTGHLVLSTVHAPDAIGAIERLLGAFPPAEQDNIQRQLADVLRAVIAQHLLPSGQPFEPPQGGPERVAAPGGVSKDRRTRPDRRTAADSRYEGPERRNRADRRASLARDRVPACEVLTVTPAVANLIATGQLAQIYSFVESGAVHGMQTMEDDLARLCVAGTISEATAFAHTRRPKVLRDHITHLTGAPGAGPRAAASRAL